MVTDELESIINQFENKSSRLALFVESDSMRLQSMTQFLSETKNHVEILKSVRNRFLFLDSLIELYHFLDQMESQSLTTKRAIVDPEKLPLMVQAFAQKMSALKEDPVLLMKDSTADMIKMFYMFVSPQIDDKKNISSDPDFAYRLKVFCEIVLKSEYESSETMTFANQSISMFEEYISLFETVQLYVSQFEAPLLEMEND